MKTRLYLFVWMFGSLLLMQACRPYNPSSYTGKPNEFATAYQEIYGHCYDSVPYAVVSLDLYSDGLTLDTAESRMEGTGYNLYISDIFVPDSLLAEGEYRSVVYTQSPVLPYTFLPGRSYEGTPHGMYLLYVSEDKLQSIQVLDSGAFVYRHDSLIFTLYYTNAYGSKATYKPVFHGNLIPCPKK